MVKVEGHYNTSGYFIENYFATIPQNTLQ